MQKFILAALLSALSIGTFAGCKTTAPESSVAVATVSGRIHVLLENGVRPEALIAAFPDYGMVSQGLASRSQNKYAITFTATGETTSEIVAAIEKHDAVISCELMKK